MSPGAVESLPPLFIVFNAGSGHGDKAVIRATIEGVLTQARRRYEMIVVDDPRQLSAIARRTVDAARARGGVVVAAGGDGTINTVAQATLGSGCAFGVLPQGTFNYFGRRHGIPSDTAAAARVLATARPHPVQVGLVNDRVFLVNASVGLYPRLLEDREAWKAQFGRSRLVAFAAGIWSLFRHRRQLRISMQQQGAARTMRTPTLFVGNNGLQLQQIGIPLADAVDNGHLAAITLRPVGNFAMAWLLLRGAFGQLGDADNVTSCSFRSMTVRRVHLFRGRGIKVATDGEVSRLVEPLEFRVSPEPLHLLKPDPPGPTAPPAGDRSP
jgi:diacylglycerol kinase family enzyme